MGGSRSPSFHLETSSREEPFPAAFRKPFPGPQDSEGPAVWLTAFIAARKRWWQFRSPNDQVIKQILSCLLAALVFTAVVVRSAAPDLLVTALVSNCSRAAFTACRVGGRGQQFPTEESLSHASLFSSESAVALILLI